MTANVGEGAEAMARACRFSYQRAVRDVTLRCDNRECLLAELRSVRFGTSPQKARKRFPIRVFHYYSVPGTLVRWPHFSITSQPRAA